MTYNWWDDRPKQLPQPKILYLLIPSFDNIHRVFSNNTRFIHSAFPFCCGVSLTMECWTIHALILTWRMDHFFIYHDFSDLSHLIFLLVFNHLAPFKQYSQNFIHSFHDLFPNPSWEVINKRNKIVHTSFRSSSGWSPNILVEKV